LETTTFAQVLGADKLWEMGFKGQDVNIALLDTGLTPDSKFQENVVEELNFFDKSSTRGRHFWHGESIAKSILHIAPNCNLSIMRVGSKFGVPDRKATTRALQYCIDNYPKYRLVNISLSFDFRNCPENCKLCSLVDEAHRKGILVVVAVGNRGEIDNEYTCPATAEWPLKVMAINTKEDNDKYLNMPFIKKAYLKMTGKLAKQMGTSFSAGYATGAASLIINAFPKIHADDLRFIMMDRARDRFEKKGGHSFPRIDDYYTRLVELKKMSKYMILTKEGHNFYPLIGEL
jgi:minor extracellular protease Epr